jgi:hypothetical protein
VPPEIFEVGKGIGVSWKGKTIRVRLPQPPPTTANPLDVIPSQAGASPLFNFTRDPSPNPTGVSSDLPKFNFAASPLPGKEFDFTFKAVDSANIPPPQVPPSKTGSPSVPPFTAWLNSTTVFNSAASGAPSLKGQGVADTGIVPPFKSAISIQLRCWKKNSALAGNSEEPNFDFFTPLSSSKDAPAKFNFNFVTPPARNHEVRRDTSALVGAPVVGGGEESGDAEKVTLGTETEMGSREN